MELNTEIKTLGGDTIFIPAKDGRKGMTLRDVVCEALLAEDQELLKDTRRSPADKQREIRHRWELAQKAYDPLASVSIRLSPEDAVTVKSLICQVFNTTIAGQSCALIDAG